MAEIRSFRKERPSGKAEGETYKEKIQRHRKVGLYRLLLLIGCLAILLIIVAYRYLTHVYTTYEVVNSQPVEMIMSSKSIPIGNQIMTYSADGAHSTNSKGEVVWNQTFEMQYIMTAQSGDTVALADYNGREAYIFTPKGKIGEIHTTMPIRAFAVADTGRVAVSVMDADVTWIHIYDPDGSRKFEIRTTMGQSGYPVSFSLSPNGELLALSCVFLDSGVVKSRVAFYNFGDVGENKSDYFMSGSNYPDTIIPMVKFMSNDCVFAVGDDRVLIFKGNQSPSLEYSYNFSEEAQAVFNNQDYVALIFPSDRLEYRNKMVLYSNYSDKRKEIYLDMDFDNIIFGEKRFTAYNGSECMISSYSGNVKYKGNFNKNTRLMIPAGKDGSYRYLVLTDNTLDTIQLK